MVKTIGKHQEKPPVSEEEKRLLTYTEMVAVELENQIQQYSQDNVITRFKEPAVKEEFELFVATLKQTVVNIRNRNTTISFNSTTAIKTVMAPWIAPGHAIIMMNDEMKVKERSNG